MCLIHTLPPIPLVRVPLHPFCNLGLRPPKNHKRGDFFKLKKQTIKMKTKCCKINVLIFRSLQVLGTYFKKSCFNLKVHSFHPCEMNHYHLHHTGILQFI